jgi:ABC-2 type transport system permease protein
MQELYRKRHTRHLQKMMKYMRYVLNDHFMLVCLFLLGGLGFYYSQILKSLPANFVWGRPLVLLVWLILLQFGRLATLAETADQVFILPKEKQMSAYLNRAVQASFLFPFVVCLLGAGMTMPLIVISTGWSFYSFIPFLLLFVSLIISHLFLQKYKLYQISAERSRVWWLVWFFSSLLVLVLALYILPIIGMLAGWVQMFLLVTLFKRETAHISLNWEEMIKKERQRLRRIYQFIQLFTDVPEIASSAKRRKYLDPLLKPIKKTQMNTYLYLYARSFLRNSEYSGVALRLAFIGGVVLLFLKGFWLMLAIALLLLYLIGFQLIPIYTQFDYMIMTFLYPITEKQKKQAVGQLITVILVGVALLFTGAAMFSLTNKFNALLVMVALGIEILLFVKGYLPIRLKRK